MTSKEALEKLLHLHICYDCTAEKDCCKTCDSRLCYEAVKKDLEVLEALKENCRFISRKENNQNEHKKKGIICLSKEQQLEIIHLYKNRLSSRKIAEKYKVSKTTIMNVIRAFTREELEK